MSRTILSGGREESFYFEIVRSNYEYSRPGERAIKLEGVNNQPAIISLESLKRLVSILEQDNSSDTYLQRFDD
jgi:hypothetical protein